MIVPRYRVEICLQNFINISKGIKNFAKQDKEDLFFFNSASEAITFYLKYISHGKKLKVGVPLYACRTVYHSVMSSDNDLVFLDIGINRNGYQIEDSKFGDLDVLIFIHYFGTQYEKVYEIKNKFPHLLIIEDCSHVNLKRYNRKNDSPNPAIFSFNFHKPVSAGSGGALLLDKKLQSDDLINRYNSLPAVTFIENCKSLVITFLKNYTFSSFFYTALQHFLKKRRHNQKIDITNLTRPRKIGWVGKYLLGNQLLKEYNTTDMYKKLPAQITLNVGCGILSYFPVFLKNESERDSLLDQLRHYKIEAYILWEKLFYNADFYGLKNSTEFPITRDMFSRILFIPEPVLVDGNKFNQLLRIISD